MPDKIVLMTLIRFLHDLATAVWIGGLIAMGLSVLPVLARRLGPGPEARALMLDIQKRLRVLVFASIAVLIVTGVLMSRRAPQFQGLLSWSNRYSAVLAWKHVLVIAMVIIAVVRGLALGRTPGTARGKPPAPAETMSGPAHPGPAQRARGAQHLPPAQRAGMVLLLLNILLGVAVVFVSALSAIIAKGGPQ